MGYARNGEIRIYFEQTGDGTPVIFAHEFGGDYRSWEPQIRYLSRFHLCVTFNARGYPPSDVPPDANAYSQDGVVTLTGASHSLAATGPPWQLSVVFL